MDTAPVDATHAAVEGRESVVFHLPSQLRLWIPAALVLGLDLWSKAWAFRSLPADQAKPIIPRVLEFRRSLNDGAVFGTFTGYVGVFIVASLFALGFVFYLFAQSSRAQRSLHWALALILAGALGNLYDRGFIEADVVLVTKQSGEQTKIIGKVLGERPDGRISVGEWPDGKPSKSYDPSELSVRRQGVVRDFIKFLPRLPRGLPRIGGYDLWPWVFNVADAALVCGVGILLLNCWLDRKPRAPSLT